MSAFLSELSAFSVAKQTMKKKKKKGAATHTDIIPILDDPSPLAARIVHLERAHIAHVAVRRIRDIHDQRRQRWLSRARSRSIPSIASEEDRPPVKPQIDKSVHVRHSRERRPVGDGQ